MVAVDAPLPLDLPSQFHHKRTIFLGSLIVPPIAQLTMSQLLHLYWESPKEEITLYINSPGSITADGLSFHNEAFSIADTLLYLPCPIKTGTLYLFLLCFEPFRFSVLSDLFV
jgi:ATP-dependent protease ClpP protease subunit